METTRVGELFDWVTQAMETQPPWVERIKKYSVEAILNYNDGPDQQRLQVVGVHWNHHLGVLELEVEN